MTPFRRYLSWLGIVAAVGGCTAAPATEPRQIDDYLQKADYIGTTDTGNAMDRWYGQSEFLSVAPRWSFFPMRSLAAEGGMADAKAANVERTVEESDVYRHDEERGLLYVLNAYRGLQVLDVSNPDAPKLVGTAELGGQPIEMYQEGDFAFVLLNSTNTSEETGEYYTSVLRVMDLSDPTQPIPVGSDFVIEGQVQGSRMLPARDADGTLVSAVIYVASHKWTRSPSEDGATWEPKSFVEAINVTSPAMPYAVDRAEFAGAGNALHVTPEAVFVAKTEYDEARDYRAFSKVQYIDISDLEGKIALGGEIEVEGRLQWGDRADLQLDHYQDHLRMATDISGRNPETGNWESRIRMTTVKTSDIHDLKVAGTLDFAAGHQILATKFHGDLAYLFHATNVDPLEIIDLRDPSNIRSLSILEINGFVDRIDVRGDKLIALGNMRHENGNRNLTMNVFDVENPTAPELLGSTNIGESWPWTSANHDLKSYSIVDELGLVMMPVSESRTDENGRWTYKQWLQLVSFDLEACEAREATCVQTRGEIDGAGYTRRAFPVADRIVSFSDLELTTADVSNPDAPTITSSFELASDVQNFRIMKGHGLMLVGSGDYQNRKAELRVLDANRPNEREAVATLELDSPTGELHEIGDSRLLMVASDWYSGETILTLIDVADPTQPRVVGQKKTAELGFQSWRRFVAMPTPTKDYAVAGQSLLAYTFPRTEEDETLGGKIRVFNVNYAYETNTFDLGAENLVDLTTVGNKIYVTTYAPVATSEEPSEEAGSSDPAAEDASAAAFLPGRMIAPFRRSYETVAYQLRIFDLSNPWEATVEGPFSVPGRFAGVTQYGDVDVVFTTDMFKNAEQVVESFDALTVNGAKLALDDVYGMAPGIAKVFVTDGRGYFVRNPNNYWNGPVILDDTAETTIVPERHPSELVALDLAWTGSAHNRDPHGNVTIRLAGTPVDLGENVYANLENVANDLVFVTAGYGKLHVFDAAGSEMRLLGAFRTSTGWGFNAMFLAADDRLFLANGLYGLQQIQIDR